MKNNIKKIEEVISAANNYKSDLTKIKNLIRFGHEPPAPYAGNKNHKIEFMNNNMKVLKDFTIQSKFELDYALKDLEFDSIDDFIDECFNSEKNK